MQVFVHFFVQFLLFFLISLNLPVRTALFFGVLCIFLTFLHKNLHFSFLFRNFAAISKV